MSTEPDIVENDDHTVLDEDDGSNPLFEGGTLFSQSDQSSIARKLAVYDTMIAAAIKAEREFQAKVRGDFGREIGVEVQFHRYTLPASVAPLATPVMIVKEKDNRTDTVITCYSDATVYIGLHAGISPGAPDTVAIVGGAGGAARVIKTSRALWAVASAEAEIDVQEEFA